MSYQKANKIDLMVVGSYIGQKWYFMAIFY